MAIESLSELNGGAAITDDQLLGLKAKLLVKIHNLLTGEDDLFDLRENGDAGFECKPSVYLAELRKMVEMIDKSLADPATRGDLAMVLTQWDNPDV
jgi:hypothetical protein